MLLRSGFVAVVAVLLVPALQVSASEYVKKVNPFLQTAELEGNQLSIYFTAMIVFDELGDTSLSNLRYESMAFSCTVDPDTGGLAWEQVRRFPALQADGQTFFEYVVPKNLDELSAGHISFAGVDSFEEDEDTLLIGEDGTSVVVVPNHYRATAPLVSQFLTIVSHEQRYVVRVSEGSVDVFSYDALFDALPENYLEPSVTPRPPTILTPANGLLYAQAAYLYQPRPDELRSVHKLIALDAETLEFQHLLDTDEMSTLFIEGGKLLGKISNELQVQKYSLNQQGILLEETYDFAGVVDNSLGGAKGIIIGTRVVMFSGQYVIVFDSDNEVVLTNTDVEATLLEALAS